LKGLDTAQDRLERILENLYQAYKAEENAKVYYWNKRFRKEGVESLKDRPRSGRPRMLPKRMEDMIRRIIEKPRITKESVSSWTTTHVRELIRRKAGVTYTTRHVIRLMHKWGFEKIKPRPEHCRAASKEAKHRFFKK
jgi:putative transposase